MAALMGHYNMLTLLLESGFDIKSVDDCGRIPLHAACGASKPSPKIVQTLLERGADLSARNLKVAGTPYQSGDIPRESLSSIPSNIRTNIYNKYILQLGAATLRLSAYYFISALV